MSMPSPDLPKQNRRIGLRGMSTGVVVLAMLTACADSSGPAASGAIVEGQPLRLEVPSATLQVPAGALSNGVDVGLSTQLWDQLKEPPDTGEVPVTEVVTIEFSKAELTDDLLVVEINVPEAADGGLYGLAKSSGGLFLHGITETGWGLVLGVLDQERSVLRFELGSSATSISLVVVHAPDTPSSMAALPVTSMRAVPNWLGRFVTNVIGGEQAHAVINPIGIKNFPLKEMEQMGWVATCRPDNFTGKQKSQCARDSEMLKRIAKLAMQSTLSLKQLGFSHVQLKVIPPTTLGTLPIPFATEPDEASPLVKGYFWVEADPDPDVKSRESNEKVEGYYHPIFNYIVVNSESEGDTLIHEIMHAVQYAEIPKAVGRDWIIEGTAAATEALPLDLKTIVPVADIRDAREFRYYESWRNWRFPLNSERKDMLDQYEVAEFWLSSTGGLQYLPQVYTIIQSGQGTRIHSGSINNTEYNIVDRGLQEALGKGIENVYWDLLKTRNSQEGYKGEKEEYCHAIELVETDSWRFSEHLKDEMVLPTAAMSAQCYKISLKSKLQCANPSLHIDLKGDERVHRFLIKGLDYKVGETAILGPQDYKPDFKLWGANVDFHALSNLSAPDVIVRARCDHAKLLGINQSIATYAMFKGAKRDDLETEQYLRQYNWDPLSGNSESTTLTRNGVDVNVQEAPLNSPNQIELSHRVTVSKGISAQAQFTTTTTNDDGEFVMDGRVRIEANGTGDAPYGFSATADASLVFSVSVPSPSIVEITNCDLFDQDSLADYGSVKAGANCSFRTAGSQTMHLPNVAGLPEIPEDFLRSALEKMDDVGEENYVGVPDEVLKEAKKLKTALSGEIFFFSINANRLESFFGDKGREVNESFNLRISPDVEEERPPRGIDNEPRVKKEKDTPLKALATHLPTHRNTPT